MDKVYDALALIGKSIFKHDPVVEILQVAVWCILFFAGLRLVLIVTYRVRKGYKDQHAAAPQVLYRHLTRFFGSLLLACLLLIAQMMTRQAMVNYSHQPDLYDTYNMSLGGLVIMGMITVCLWIACHFNLFLATGFTGLCDRWDNFSAVVRSKRMDAELTKILREGARAHGHGK